MFVLKKCHAGEDFMWKYLIFLWLSFMPILLKLNSTCSAKRFLNSKAEDPDSKDRRVDID